MPYTIRKVKNRNCYLVKNIDNDKIHAKCSTLENAKKQYRLLNAIDHGWKLSKKRSKVRSHKVKSKRIRSRKIKSKVRSKKHRSKKMKSRKIKSEKKMNLKIFLRV